RVDDPHIGAFPLQFGQRDGQGTSPKRHHGGDVELPPFAPGRHRALWVSIDQRGFSAVKQSLYRQRSRKHGFTHTTFLRQDRNNNHTTDIEQVLREKKPFILRCMLDGIKKLQGRIVTWNRCALSVSITWA